MDPAKRKTRLVTFRVSDVEYKELLSLCEYSGTRSISALARYAIDQIRKKDEDTIPLKDRIEETVLGLDRRIKAVERIVRRLSRDDHAAEGGAGR